MKKKFIFVAMLIALLALVHTLITGLWPFQTSGKSIRFEDRNSNGIWDDVEPFIKANAKNDLQEKALEFEAKAFQEIILNPDNALEVKQGNRSKDILGRALACNSIIWGRGATAQPEPDIRDTILSSPTRIRAYIKYHKNLSGAVLSSWDVKTEGNPCPFKVEN